MSDKSDRLMKEGGFVFSVFFIAIFATALLGLMGFASGRETVAALYVIGFAIAVYALVGVLRMSNDF